MFSIKKEIIHKDIDFKSIYLQTPGFGNILFRVLATFYSVFWKHMPPK